MPTITLKSGETLTAINGKIGNASFKVWSKDGSEKLLKLIKHRTIERTAYFTLSPTAKGLMDPRTRGGRHSVAIKRGIAKSQANKVGWRKYYAPHGIEHPQRRTYKRRGKIQTVSPGRI